MHTHPYKALMWTVGIHFFIMYTLTYAPVNAFADIPVFSARSFYMAVIMVAPMIFLMLFFMRNMYKNLYLTISLYTVSIVLFAVFFFFIRGQIFVGNEQFLNSMIPHHSSAITMCQEASITDQEIAKLCEAIIKTQQEEIHQMKEIRARIN